MTAQSLYNLYFADPMQMHIHQNNDEKAICGKTKTTPNWELNKIETIKEIDYALQNPKFNLDIFTDMTGEKNPAEICETCFQTAKTNLEK